MMLIQVLMATADVSVLAQCDNSTPSYISCVVAAVAVRPVLRLGNMPAASRYEPTLV